LNDINISALTWNLPSKPTTGTQAKSYPPGNFQATTAGSYPIKGYPGVYHNGVYNAAANYPIGGYQEGGYNNNVAGRNNLSK